jgi:RNA polymerase sigma-70 factor, ECF subfamily
MPERASHSFDRLAEPLRREIKLHCYRMLGSVHEAEDLTQDSYIRAWRAYDTFVGGSFRAWLYKIATNACLNAIEARKVARRVLPEQLGASTTERPDPTPPTDIAWLEPFPDSLLEGALGSIPSPEARFAGREAVELAFVAVVQELPPRQRAAVLLCDVLGWSSAEAAADLSTTTASINSSLQRGRDALAKRYPRERAQAGADDPDLVARYVKAWEGHDVEGLVALLAKDATFAMPPWLEWYAGRDVIGAFFAEAWKTCGGLRLLPTAANAQPALAVYERSRTDGRFIAHAIHVLTVDDGVVETVTAFQPPTGPKLFPFFGLPANL